MPELELSLSWAHNNTSARASARFPLVPHAPDCGPSLSPPLCQPRSSSSPRSSARANAVPFPPLFPFQPPVCSERTRHSAATEAALCKARPLAGRSPAPVWATEVPRASRVSHSANDLLEGLQLSTGALSRRAQVAEQLFTLLPLWAPCRRGGFRDALPVASLDCPHRRVARDKGRGCFRARRTEGPSSSDPRQAPGCGAWQAAGTAGSRSLNRAGEGMTHCRGHTRRSDWAWGIV